MKENFYYKQLYYIFPKTYFMKYIFRNLEGEQPILLSKTSIAA